MLSDKFFMNKSNNKFKLLAPSVLIALILLAIGSLFKKECSLVEPGGINEGWAGAPIPYYWCGVWGEQFYWWILGFDIVLLTLLSYIVLRMIYSRRK